MRMVRKLDINNKINSQCVILKCTYVFITFICVRNNACSMLKAFVPQLMKNMMN